MFIQSQDGKSLYNVENIESVYLHDYRIYVYTQKDTEIIGIYNTESAAEIAFQELIDWINDFVGDPRMVFQMPEK